MIYAMFSAFGCSATSRAGAISRKGDRKSAPRLIFSGVDEKLLISRLQVRVLPGARIRLKPPVS